MADEHFGYEFCPYCKTWIIYTFFEKHIKEHEKEKAKKQKEILKWIETSIGGKSNDI